MSAKKLDVDIESVTFLAERGFTKREIAAYLNVSESTFSRRMTDEQYQQAFELGLARASGSVKLKLFQKADEGNITALTHLSDRICCPKRRVITENEFKLGKDKDSTPEVIIVTPEEIEAFDKEFNELY